MGEKQDQMIIQNCNDPEKWPLAQLAQAAADWKPDLVIHVGDYHYREIPCPPGNVFCQDSVSGDNWISWKQDFFLPVKPLLAAAPWVFVRGNHELCKNGGNGWFQFLDPRPMVTTCKDATEPYIIPLGDHSLVVIDAADDKNIQSSLDKLQLPRNSKIWLAQHRPFLTPGGDLTATVQSHLPPRMLNSGKIKAVFVGHAHLLSLNSFSNGLPPELISGNGGTFLYSPPRPDQKTEQSTTQGVTTFKIWDFGFLTLEKKAKGQWILTEHDRAGTAVAKCKLVESRKTDLQCHLL
jgi:hypothetical protein